MPIETLAIYGVGLLGGSVGLAVKARAIARRVVGIGRSAERLGRAVDLGAIDQATTSIEEGCRQADCIVLASTVSHILDLLPLVAKACKPTAIVTDVGSTKATIVARSDSIFAPAGPFFVGSHPMAGSERTGVENASADLFQDACCIVTPTSVTQPDAADRVETFWRNLGARVIRLDPLRHDRLISVVSHLPHLTAAAVLLVAEQAGEDADLLATLLGNGFRDCTRVAAGSETIWRDICLENCGPIAENLDRLADRLRQLAEQVRRGDAQQIVEQLRRARQLRQRLIP